MNQYQAFYQRIDKALHNDQLRRNFRSAMDGIRERRLAQFPDDRQLQALRYRAKGIRNRSLSRQAELLEQLEAKLTENGIQVHWAETPLQANALIHEILEAEQATFVVK
ncbi:MAG: (Fe-S)-binding protein, partial [Candidatus Thiodiazotropha weberae]|nr:(Fe-S)-binding protein [Candidatus Thiodiazotropha weberae]